MKLTAIIPIKHDGKLVAPEKEFEVDDDEQAQALIDHGIAKPQGKRAEAEPAHAKDAEKRKG